MKSAITGYITAIINEHTRKIENLKAVKAGAETVKRAMEIREQWNDLLDYVADIPEETKKPITVTFNSNNDEVDKLKKYIRELEDCCENMSEVERNLHKKILELKDNNRMWEAKFNQLKEELESTEEAR